MQVKVIDVTPSLAQYILDNNTETNRPLSDLTIQRYSDDMRTGRWMFTSQTISLVGCDLEELAKKRGPVALVNGMHRLKAVVDSNTKQQFLFAVEENRETFAVFDIGRPRTLATMASLLGYKSATHVSSLGKAAVSYERHPDELWGQYTCTNEEVKEWLERADRPLVDRCVNWMLEFRGNGLRGASVWYSTLAYAVNTESPNNARWLEFHGSVVGGYNMAEGDPRLALRNNALNRAIGGKRVGKIWERQMLLGAGIAAWNLWIDGETREHLRFTQKSLPLPRPH